MTPEHARAYAKANAIFHTPGICYGEIYQALVDAYIALELATAPLCPGWFCAYCDAFNGTAKEDRQECRCCGRSVSRTHVVIRGRKDGKMFASEETRGSEEKEGA